MTEEQAIERIRYRIETASDIAGKGVDGKAFEDLEMAISALEEIRQYWALGTVEELREAREKQAPEKPTMKDLCTCPKCGTYNETIKKRRNTVNNDIVYCWHCGQAMEVNRLE